MSAKRKIADKWGAEDNSMHKKYSEKLERYG
jgi:hypothetical protein